MWYRDTHLAAVAIPTDYQMGLCQGLGQVRISDNLPKIGRPSSPKGPCSALDSEAVPGPIFFWLYTVTEVLSVKAAYFDLKPWNPGKPELGRHFKWGLF